MDRHQRSSYGNRDIEGAQRWQMNPSHTTSANFARLLARSKRWMMRQSMRLNASRLPLQPTRPTKSKPIHFRAASVNQQSAESFKALGLANRARLANSVMASHLNVYLVEDRLGTSGLVMSSGLIVTHSSQTAHRAEAEAILATSFTPPYARFSLN